MLSAQKIKSKDLSLVSGKFIHFKNNSAKIEVRLWNRSKDTLKYLSMSCSWQEFYLTNHKDVNIRVDECDKNVPRILTLKPNESRTVEIEIVATKDILDEFKVGIHIVQTKEPVIPNDDYVLKHSQVIWCSSIYSKK